MFDVEVGTWHMPKTRVQKKIFERKLNQEQNVTTTIHSIPKQDQHTHSNILHQYQKRSTDEI